MKKILVFVIVTFLFLAGYAQNSIDQCKLEIRQNKEAYIEIQNWKKLPITELTRFVSIDNIEKNALKAYINQKGLEYLLDS